MDDDTMKIVPTCSSSSVKFSPSSLATRFKLLKDILPYT